MPIAMAFSEYGPPEILTPAEIGTEHPDTGQVRVRIRAAGVQPFDCALRRGDYARWMPVRFPCRLGSEFAGAVDEVGEGVTSVVVGAEVLGFQQLGCHAESVVVDAGQLVAKPPDMPWEEAGVLSASGQTADTALDELRVGPGDVLVVHAAAGGVGSFAVQLARAAGATVIGTARPVNHAYLSSLGAVPVAYGPGLADRIGALAPDGVTVVLDCIGGEALDVSVTLVQDRTRIGTVADRGGAGRLGVCAISTDRSSERLARLVARYRAGGLRIPIWRSWPLRDAALAHREVELGHVRGKVVLTMDVAALR